MGARLHWGRRQASTSVGTDSVGYCSLIRAGAPPALKAYHIGRICSGLTARMRQKAQQDDWQGTLEEKAPSQVIAVYISQGSLQGPLEGARYLTALRLNKAVPFDRRIRP